MDNRKEYKTTLLAEAFKIELDKHKPLKQITNFVTIGFLREGICTFKS